MIPLGATSLNDIVTDLDLTTANANLNDGYIRNRVGKYSGAISIGDLRGSFACTQDKVLSNWGSIPLRYINGRDYYDPRNNESASELRMVSDGDASQGIKYYAEHRSQGGGDFGVNSVHVNTVPANLACELTMTGTIDADWTPIRSLYFMKTEVISWNGGNYYAGTPTIYLSREWVSQSVDLSSVPPIQFGIGLSVRHVTILHYSIIKSAAPDADYFSGTLNNFTARITAT
jgi:hypothetical protein